jgi:hypothetical protein
MLLDNRGNHVAGDDNAEHGDDNCVVHMCSPFLFRLKARSRRPSFVSGRPLSRPHKVNFGLRSRAGLTAPNRAGISPVSCPWSWFSANVRIRTAISQPNAGPVSTNCRNGCQLEIGGPPG